MLAIWLKRVHFRQTITTEEFEQQFPGENKTSFLTLVYQLTYVFVRETAGRRVSLPELSNRNMLHFSQSAMRCL